MAPGGAAAGGEGSEGLPAALGRGGLDSPPGPDTMPSMKLKAAVDVHYDEPQLSDEA